MGPWPAALVPVPKPKPTHLPVTQGCDAGTVKRDTTESYDIYLLPPNEDAESCASWLRMRYRDGRYSLMFEEWVVDGSVIISPRVTFEVPVRILGGLMALGYDVGTIMRRTSRTFSNERWVGTGAVRVTCLVVACKAVRLCVGLCGWESSCQLVQLCAAMWCVDLQAEWASGSPLSAPAAAQQGPCTAAHHIRTAG